MAKFLGPELGREIEAMFLYISKQLCGIDDIS
jgi:hypothetical protein